MLRLRTRLIEVVRRVIEDRPRAKKAILKAEEARELVRHTAATFAPILITADPQKLVVSITANCNLRCVGCHYGREFMPGHQLTQVRVFELLDDAALVGMHTVRFYGGEPLLHPGLPAMIAHAVKVGMRPYITTNGLLLREKIDELYSAGLRTATIGFYGIEDSYDLYVQIEGRFSQLTNSLDYVRSKYGASFNLQINFLLMRPSCNLRSLHAAWEFAKRYDTAFQVDLVHYSLPYFSEGPDGCLQFRTEDRGAIDEVVRELLNFKHDDPERYKEPAASIRSIPDWLLRREEMRIPCDARRLVWVGPDGTVQMCYAAHRLGNINERRFRELMRTPQHNKAARCAFQLDCPNCHCERAGRIQKHWPSRRMYSAK